LSGSSNCSEIEIYRKAAFAGGLFCAVVNFRNSYYTLFGEGVGNIKIYCYLERAFTAITICLLEYINILYGIIVDNTNLAMEQKGQSLSKGLPLITIL
jgi:hypothetical protein